MWLTLGSRVSTWTCKYVKLFVTRSLQQTKPTNQPLTWTPTLPEGMGPREGKKKKAGLQGAVKGQPNSQHVCQTTAHDFTPSQKDPTMKREPIWTAATNTEHSNAGIKRRRASLDSAMDKTEANKQHRPTRGARAADPNQTWELPVGLVCTVYTCVPRAPAR